MGRLSTHVLDVAGGVPAVGVHLEVWKLGPAGEKQLLKAVVTNGQGRTDEPLLPDGELETATYELVFDAGAYFKARGQGATFLGLVPIRFTVSDSESNYHVPLVMSPWAYSTYRGS